MRVPITAIPPILTDIATGLGVPVSQLGILTSLPLIMFALCSSLAPLLAKKFGNEWLITLVLTTMLLGSVMRIVNLPFLFIGTMLLGAGIAVINVLLPSLVSTYFPKQVGRYTTLYITTMGAMATVGSVVAVPAVSASSWKTFILLLTAVIGLALVVWLPNLSRQSRAKRKKEGVVLPSMWTNKTAWIFLIFGGLQSLIYYTELTWLPTMARTAGLTGSEAGILAGIFSFISIPISMVTPTIVARLKKEERAKVMLGVSSIMVVGLLLILIAPGNFMMWLVIHLLLGASVSVLFPYLMLSLSLKTSTTQATAQLSGMVQTGGYLIAATGPVFLGYSYSRFGSWHPLVLILLLVTLLMMWTIVLIEKKETIA
ncbi:MFS transporter [Streptococcus himalayensis]|uniref:MFS transporter n=2 Tax=Streptococcus himalayensis TaxID=1888195 RepID=A0A917A707_9STRE|nr:MFS transporter [Streptococcus himalayensis]